jgi:AcrR family transcriptional regulator
MPQITKKAADAPPAAPVMPRGTHNDRRWQEVLDAAAELFEEKGYRATTLQEVAARAGMLAPSLYYYIKNKEDLLFAVMQRAHQIGLSLIEEPPELACADAETRLSAFIKRWMGGTYPPVIRVVERDLRYLSPDRQAEVLAWRDRMNHFVRRIVRQGMKEGQFARNADPSIVANTFFVVLNSTPTWFREPGRVSYAELTEWYAQLFVRGLRTSS